MSEPVISVPGWVIGWNEIGYIPKLQNREPMKILLQHCSAALFLENLDRWTSDPMRAMAFDDILSAALFCASNEVRGIRFALQSMYNNGGTSQLSGDITNFPFC